MNINPKLITYVSVRVFALLLVCGAPFWLRAQTNSLHQIQFRDTEFSCTMQVVTNLLNGAAHTISVSLRNTSSEKPAEIILFQDVLHNFYITIRDSKGKLISKQLELLPHTRKSQSKIVKMEPLAEKRWSIPLSAWLAETLEAEELPNCTIRLNVALSLDGKVVHGVLKQNNVLLTKTDLKLGTKIEEVR